MTESRRSTRPAPARTIARRFEADLSAPVLAAGTRIQNVRQISERVAMGRALWRELVIGFASQLGELRLGFTQLAALYVLADGSTLTVGELADAINRSPSATSRLIDGLVRRRLVERRQEEEDKRQKVLRLTPRGHAILRVVDRGRAEQFLGAVRPLPTAEAGDRRDGRRRPGEPCHESAWPLHPGATRTGDLADTRAPTSQLQNRRTTSSRTGRPKRRASSETRSSTPWNRSRKRSSGSSRSGEKP